VGTRREVRLSDRLTYWTEPHPNWQPNPEWPIDVGSVTYATDDALVLIDPLVRDDLSTKAWGWLDAAVERADRNVVVLLTAPWHERSTRAVVTRYAASVWIDPVARERVSDLRQLETVPGEIEVFQPRGVKEGQVAFFIERERALVVAEFFLGTAAGLRVCPSPATHDIGAFTASLDQLRHLSIERVLVAHGPPILEGGSDAIAAALRRNELARVENTIA
jgi:glyoxylase-like metal-dependent hydrolase (beta-lactamase superfamily II)